MLNVKQGSCEYQLLKSFGGHVPVKSNDINTLDAINLYMNFIILISLIHFFVLFREAWMSLKH